MKTRTRIFIFLLIILFLLPTSSIAINLFHEENEAYGYAGLLAAIPLSTVEEVGEFVEVEPEPEPEATVAEAKPKPSNIPPRPPASEVKSPVKNEQETYFILKWTGDFCLPCKEWEKTEFPKLQDKCIPVERIYAETRQSDFKKHGVKTVPSFWICRVSDRRPIKKITGKVSASELMSYIPRKSMYTRKSTRMWDVDGDKNPSKEKLIAHLKQSKNHPSFRTADLSVFSREELLWMHADDHNGFK